MSQYTLEIDGGPAEAGAERIVKSFDRIKAAMDRMEGSVVESAKKMVAAFSQLSNVRTVSREAIDSLNSLSSSLAKYRGPTKTSVDNTQSFLTMMRGFAGFRAPSSAGLDRFLNALNKYAGPTPTAGKNTESLLRALSGFSGVAGANARVTAFLASLASFRGPPPTAGRNVQALFAALQTFTGLPRGFASSSQAFMDFARAVDAATAAFTRLRAASTPAIHAPVIPAAPRAGGGAGGAGAASAGISTLIQQHGILQTSILRTRTAMNSLGGVLALREIVNASNSMLKLNAQFQAATGSSRAAGYEIGFLRELTDRLGLSIVETGRSYGLFLGSIKGTNTSIAEARDIFEGFAVAGRALQLSTADMDGVFRALGQIISKGKLQAEELRGQLGDRLPGAFIRMSAALGVVPAKLDDMMKKGQISGQVLEDALKKMADSLKEEFTPAAVAASKTVDAAFNRLRNAFVDAAAGLGSSGLNAGLIDIADGIRTLLRSEGLAVMLRGIGLAFKFVGENADLLGAILAGGLVWGAAKMAASFLGLTAAVTGTSAAMTMGATATAANSAATATNTAVTTAATARQGGLAALRGVLTAATTAFTVAQTRATVAVSVSTAAIAANTTATVAQTAASNVLAATTGVVAGAFTALRVVLFSMPFAALGILIGGLVYYLTQTRTEANKLNDELTSLGRGAATIGQFIEAYSMKLDENSKSLFENSVQLNQNAEAQIRNRAAQQSIEGNYRAGRGAKSLSFLGAAAAALSGNAGAAVAASEAYEDPNKVYDASTGKTVMKDLAKLIGQANRKITSVQDFDAVAKAARDLDVAAIRGLKGTDSASFQNERYKVQGRLEYLRKNSDEFAKTFGFSPADRLEQLAPGYQNGGTNLPDLVKPAKPDKAAEARARQDEADLRRAMERVRDLRREITISYDAVEALRTSSEAGVAQQGRAVAEAQLNNIEDSYGSIDRAKAGIQKLAGMLKSQAQATISAVDQAKAVVDRAESGQTVEAGQLTQAKRVLATTTQAEIDAAYKLRSANISTYTDSREAAKEHLGALEELSLRRAKDLELQREIRQTNDDVALRSGRVVNGVQGVDMVRATLEGGDALRRATIANEAMAQSFDGTEEERRRFIRDLVESKTKADDLSRALEMAAQLNQDRLFARNARDTAGLYTQGLNPRDLDYYKTLIEYRNKLESEGGYSGEAIATLLDEKRAVLDLTRTMEDLAAQHEKIRQVSQDQADAIVEGFRRGAEEGQSFRRTMKDIFSDLKRILLDYVLYNPLREFLTDAFTGVNSRRYGSTELVSRSGSQAQDVGSFSRSATDIIHAALGMGGAAATIGGAAAPAGALARSGAAAGEAMGATIAPIISTGLDDVLTKEIHVVGPGSFGQSTTPAPTSGAQTAGNFSALRQLFDYRNNGVLDGFKGGIGKIGDAFNKTKSLGANLKTFGDGLGAVAQSAGTAFAAYSVGKGVARSLGIKGAAGEAIGGAAAGFSVAGPAGAAVGAVAGFLKGTLFKKKTPSAFVNISVGDTGRAGAGTVGTHGKVGAEGRAAAGAAGAAASGFLNDFATQFNAILGAGQYGTFGKRKDKAFYSTTGELKKGKPRGVEGVDYIYGTDSELQAFALKSNIRAGRVQLPTDSLRTVAANTQATTTEGLYSDFGVAKAFDDFIKGSFRTTDLKRQVDQLNESFEALRRQSSALGLSETRLAKARDRMLAVMRDEFDFNISQGILGIQDPITAEYNQLLKEYRDSVSDAVAIGGDLTAVEKYYGLQRVELVKKYSQDANNSIKSAADELLTSLTASSSSPLTANTVLSNARDEFLGLRGQFERGDYTNLDKLSGYAQNYLSAAQSVHSSSTEYFSIFRSVTDYLKQMSATTAVLSGTDPNSLPELPSLEALVEEVKAANKEAAEATNSVGAAVVEASAAEQDLLQQLIDQGHDTQALLAAGLGITNNNTGQGSSGGLRTVAETVALF